MASGAYGRAKALFERTLAASGLRSRGGRGLQGRVLVFAWHNIVPHGEQRCGDTSLHLSQAAFGDQLDLIAETLPVFSLNDALSNPPDSESPPKAVLTWDDAYAGAVTAGVEEVCRRGLAATVFVPPGCLGGGGFWWDALAVNGALEPALRTECLGRLRGRADLIQEEARDRNWRWVEPPAHARPADGPTLDRALALPGISAGAHSWTHPNLALATDTELGLELEQSLGWVRRLGATGIPVIAYPYGAAGDAVERAARAAGSLAGLMIEGGAWDPVAQRRTAIPRFNVAAGLSLPGLMLRLHGWLLQ